MNSNSLTEQLRWTPLGGLGEVGMNCMIFEFPQKTLPIDAGVLFADTNDLGVDLVFPDFRSHLKSGKITDWIITHSHEDHIGAISGIMKLCEELNVSIPRFWCPPFAAAFIKEKLKSETSRFLSNKKYLDQVESVPCGGCLEWGDLKFRLFETRHSTVDSCSVALEWKKELRIIHTSDFKLDHSSFSDGVISESSYDVFENSAKPDIVFIDSTNADRYGEMVSELDVAKNLERALEKCSGRFIVTLFSSNIFRISALIAAGIKQKRIPCLVGRSLKMAWQVAHDLGIPQKYFPQLENIIPYDLEEMLSLASEKQLIICSGSQGEFRSALVQASRDNHPYLKLNSEDTVLFSSIIIPGNEPAVLNLINDLLRKDILVLWGQKAERWSEGPVHGSGHAKSHEIAKLLTFLNPRYVVPVHGEFYQLAACAEVAKNSCPQGSVQICENNESLIFKRSDEGKWIFAQKEPNIDRVEKFLRFENFQSSSGELFLKIRKRCASAGVLSAVLDSLGRVYVECQGIFPESILEQENIKENVESWFHSKYKNLLRIRAFTGNNKELEKELADDLSKMFRRNFGIRPHVILHLLE